ncbi:MAG: DUF3343 domain-containing protein [Blautia sp.]
MREKKLELVVTFHTTTQAIAMEKMCMAQNFPGRLIPLPRAISAGCGLCWCTSLEAKEETEKKLEEYKLGFDRIYQVLL